MTCRQFFIKRWEEEHPMFSLVFQRLPQDQPGYRPHPRSRSAAQLVWLLALEERACSGWIDSGTVKWKETPAPARLQRAIAAYEKAHAELVPRLKKINDKTWDGKPARLIAPDSAVYEMPLGEMLWAVLFDQIHHRGQLTLYIRLTGGKVPGIYGASADEKAR